MGVASLGQLAAGGRGGRGLSPPAAAGGIAAVVPLQSPCARRLGRENPGGRQGAPKKVGGGAAAGP